MKYPIWIKDRESGGYVRIPYDKMTTFEDGQKGFYAAQQLDCGVDMRLFVSEGEEAQAFVTKYRSYFKEQEVDTFIIKMIFTGRKQFPRVTFYRVFWVALFIFNTVSCAALLVKTLFMPNY